MTMWSSAMTPRAYREATATARASGGYSPRARAPSAQASVDRALVGEAAFAATLRARPRDGRASELGARGHDGRRPAQGTPGGATRVAQPAPPARDVGGLKTALRPGPPVQSRGLRATVADHRRRCTPSDARHPRAIRTRDIDHGGLHGGAVDRVGGWHLLRCRRTTDPGHARARLGRGP